MNKHEERAQYILDKQLTIVEAAALLKLDQSTVRRSIKLAGGDWKKKIDTMISWKNSTIGKPVNKKTNKTEVYLYEKRVREIINNLNATSYKKAAKILGITIKQLSSSITLLKLHDKFLYDEFHSIMQERFLQSKRYMKIINYVLKHPKCSREDVANKFKCSNNIISDSLSKIKYRFPDKYKKVIEIFNKNKNPKYKQIAQHIINTNATYKETGKKFNLSEQTIASNINLLCRLNEPKMYKTIKQMKALKKGRTKKKK